MHFSPPRFAPKRPIGLSKCGLVALSLAALAPAAQAQTQDLFVTNFGNKTVTRFAGTGPGTFSKTATALSSPSLNQQPSGLVFDKSGDLFVGNYISGGGTIVEFAAGATPGSFGATSSFTDSSLKGPSALTLDTLGDLFVANSQSKSVTEFAAGATPGTFGAASALTDPSLNVPIGVALDASGDLFVTNQNGNSITKFAAGAVPGTFGAVTTLNDPSLNAPQGLVFDAKGDLFVSNVSGGIGSNGSITEFLAGATPGTFGAGTTFATATAGVLGPVALAFDARGDLFAANNYAGSISEFAFNPALGTFGAAQTVETGLSGAISLAFGPSAPVPEASTTVSLGLLLILGAGGVVMARKRRKPRPSA